ncbi:MULTISPECIES: alpha-1,4-glucan--maltose-1-phosphate maltosyltransferase [unclassified Rhizobium]|uniref:alpha-1,4-glucan--maltose-1-phosphate maltosyltransferase n=1 Tax=unclassified Rhizobium TaxID=2613769 RepID=UPI0007EABBE3|nr:MULTISPECIES: alpha-1,4-glucan--maltose-1-phosphate maltosyltransferase [unclassified Rhizobium]ANK88847.1 alpha-1,4-glucan:maltose-1-phosphate maltosyltransferase [Rhizobium sp. N731]ANL19100.1 alpha-1,4-glucan:maltose-1-phosphate maltosyltransferase [Rhizobium sp. N1314]
MLLSAKQGAFSTPPRIYYVNPLLLQGIDAWGEVFGHAADTGFDYVLTAPLFDRGGDCSVFTSRDFDRLDPELQLGSAVDDGISRLAEAAEKGGVGLMMDLMLDGKVGDAQAVRPVDPRRSPLDPAEPMNTIGSERQLRLLGEWTERLWRLSGLGLSGYRVLGIDRAAPALFKSLIASVREKADAQFLAWTPGTDFAVRRAIADAGFSGCFSSMAWWDLDERWFVEEHRVQEALGWQVAFPEPPFARRIAHGTESREILERRAVRALRLAASLGGGLMVPMGFEYGAATPLDPTHGDGSGLRKLRHDLAFDISSEIRVANAEIGRAGQARAPSLRLIRNANGPVSALVQSEEQDLRSASNVRFVLINRDLRRSASAPMTALREAASGYLPVAADGAVLRLRAGETRIIESKAPEPIASRPALDVEQAIASPRLAIENIMPRVDDGRFPVKRVIGETVTVEADIFADGHDPIAAVLLWRPHDAMAEWKETEMQLVENDRWRAEFLLERIGRHEFAVEAWKNPFTIFRYELTKKNDARLDLKLELQEGLNLVRAAKAEAPPALGADLQVLIDSLENASDAERTAILLDPETSELMNKADRRPFRLRSTTSAVDAERKSAAFASWYQIFPRSQSGDPNRHGTFDDVIPRLADIRDMGFDVLYFPPIHPIGSTNRKGRNNSLKAVPGDPGSPYAIGSEEGGHDAIHPELGDFEDFGRLVEEAGRHGLEIALDLAIQASPDHPWLTEHPGWFDWRPDGTIKYAENPPKKYEDIVNVDFYTKDALPSLWVELRDVVQLWVDQGVKLFRVDNPHTKPFPFWEWLIGDIRARHPEVVFLSEAFTRPKVMYRLAKIGFSQSYTYFTWRNTKWELEQYMRELTEAAPKEFFRPHFFVNTHDINPDFLQNAPRPAFLIRAALAATLSGLWGVYNGFELCEGRPDAKRKEYADSEKYEIRAWDYDRPGNIIAEIRMLNRIRNENTALHSHLGLTLLNARNDNILFFEKASRARDNVLLIAISLDPHNFQESDVELPLWKWSLDDGGALDAEDLVTGQRFRWSGKRQRVGFNPQILPFAIWRVRAAEA